MEDQSRLMRAIGEKQDAYEALQSWNAGLNAGLAMKYEPKTVGSTHVTNYSGSSLTSTGNR